MDKNIKIKKLVFSGGGIKGLCFLGCIKALELYNIIPHIEYFVGSSAGSITAYLLNIGYDSRDLIDIITEINLEFMKDITSECILNYFNNFGIDTGKNIMKIIEILSSKKNIKKNITFQELYEKTNKILVITGTNLNEKKTVFFDKNNYPQMKILEALRISISIPYIFNICHYENNSYIDGSIVCNYPISYFNKYDDILGFLIETNNNNLSEIRRIDDFTIAIINCLIQKDVNFNKEKYKEQTISINIDINSLNFNLTKPEKKQLFETGYENTLNFLISKYCLFALDDTLISEIKNHKNNK